MIKQASSQDAGIVSALALKLWPYCSLPALQTEYTSLLSAETCAVFLYYIQSEPIAFAQCQLRNDYVEGSSSSPVGYLEAIFVDPQHRRHGLAKELVRHCEQWTRSKGCTEFASDCELQNADSLRFHLNAGFTEANRIICFIKKL